ncbi:MAG: helix-turn-helix transcriptional regulator [Bacteroidota bacterium]
MKNYIGEFEEVVLLTVAILHGNAYGVNIKDDIENRLGREVSIGALQVTLRRLEQKGLLESTLGEGDAIRGGRPKRYFTITAYGKKALHVTRDMRNTLWNAVPDFVLDLSRS